MARLVYNMYKGLEQVVPSMLNKVGTIFLFIFSVGMLFGYMYVTSKPWVIIIPFVSMYFMWHSLDKGLLVLIGLMGLAFYTP